jgi:hypothetical protein
VPYQYDTYDRRIQLGASRRRREDAESLHAAGRWAGALWHKDVLRYWDRVGNRQDGKRFMSAMQMLHNFILGQQGET